MGLPNIQRYSDKMVIVSEVDKGVVLEMQFYKKNSD
jgi:anti-sigma regulatory factor (Ser/Thr protein kinase)